MPRGLRVRNNNKNNNIVTIVIISPQQQHSNNNNINTVTDVPTTSTVIVRIPWLPARYTKLPRLVAFCVQRCNILSNVRVINGRARTCYEYIITLYVCELAE